MQIPSSRKYLWKNLRPLNTLLFPKSNRRVLEFPTPLQKFLLNGISLDFNNTLYPFK